MKRFFIFLVFVVLCFNIRAQGDLDSQGKIFYRNERSVAGSLNSNGFGINGRFGIRIDAANKILWDIDLAYYRNPKEEHLTNPAFSNINIISNTSNFVMGKQYLPLLIKGGYGKQKEIFRKFDVGGISVRRFYTFGPTLAILKPVYYNYFVGKDSFEIKRFSRSLYVLDIAGRASFFKGLSELKIIPGAFLKYGFCFEYSKKDQVLHAVEAGFLVEGFAEKLPVMATDENYQFFITLFISYRFGRIFDPHAPKRKRKKEDFSY